MAYKSIRRLVAMSNSSQPAERLADAIYHERVESDSAVLSGVKAHDGHEFFCVVTAEIVRLMDQIYRADKEIERAWNALPEYARSMYQERLVSSELENTHDIEGIETTWQETWKAVDAVKHSRKKLPRFGSSARAYLDIDRGIQHPHTLLDIRVIYDRVTAGEVDAADLPDGALFRRGNVEIRDPGKVQAVHRGVVAEQVEDYLREWLEFAHDESVPSLIRAAMCHFIFEYIHPFYDGNGRTGRYLLALQLARVLSLPTLLSLSQVIRAHKAKYYKAFVEAQNPLNCAELTMFVETMLGFVTEAQHEVLGVLTGDEVALCEISDSDSSLEKVLRLFIAQEHFGYHPEQGMSIGEVSERLGMNRNKVATILKDLSSELPLSSIGDFSVLDDQMKEFVSSHRFVREGGSGQRAGRVKQVRREK